MGNASSGEGSEQTDFKPTGGTGPDVFLNVYVPTKNGSSGVYHTGIEINGVEYAFAGGSVSGSGVYKQTPKEDPPGEQWAFKTSMPMGKAKVAASQVGSIADKLGVDHFPAADYDVISKNCNHFTEAFSKALGVHINYPSYINRMARTGATFGMGKGHKAVEVEEAKTVFETTQGHKLDTNDDATKKAVAEMPKGRDGRPNPWAAKKA